MRKPLLLLGAGGCVALVIPLLLSLPRERVTTSEELREWRKVPPALARKLARPEFTVRGATPCVGLLTLEEYLHELEPFDVRAYEVH